MSATLNHLPFYTFQKPCKFPPATADTAFYRAFGDSENLRYLFVIHILQIAKDNCFAKLWRELFEGALDSGLEFEAGDVMLLGGCRIGESVAHGGAVVIAVEGGVEGVGGAVEAGAAKVIDEEVPGQSGDPGLEAALLEVEATEVLIELEEDVLG
jgi:hypothetical protein